MVNLPLHLNSAIDLHASPVPNLSVVHLQMGLQARGRGSHTTEQSTIMGPRLLVLVALAAYSCHALPSATDAVVPEVIDRCHTLPVCVACSSIWCCRE